MKAFRPCTALLLLTLALPSTAQTEDLAPCAGCSAKSSEIEALQAKLQQLQSPAQEEAPSELAASAEVATYTVQAGDGLMKIARKQGCSTQALADANGLSLDAVIYPGQKLKLPSAASTPAPAKAEATPAAAPTPAAAKTYTIVEGDTYYSLSRRLNIPLDALMAANPKAKATQLYQGRVINLPATPATSSEPAAPVEAPALTTVEIAPETAPSTPPAPSEVPPAEAAPEEAVAPAAGKTVHAVIVDSEITYGDFAEKHHTTITRLNSLNDLSLTSTTILATGSELYVPAQP